MEIGEAIAVEAVAQDPKEDCWYCKQPGGENPVNDEAADPDTSDAELPDLVPENAEGNDSSKLGKSLIKHGKDEPKWEIDNPLKPGTSTKIVPAAHHCIPGEASLAQASALHDFMRKDGPNDFASDIGYNVNHANNGVWLPGNYAVRADNPEFNLKTWSAHAPSFQKTYVKRAMAEASGKMFHDAHRKYNGKVLGTLNSIAAKLTKPDKKKCPICKAELNKGKARPPFGLVGRLDFVSGKHRTMLLSPTPTTVEAGYFTSSKGRDVVNPPLET
jgi:hypothetical protein